MPNIADFFIADAISVLIWAQSALIASRGAGTACFAWAGVWLAQHLGIDTESAGNRVLRMLFAFVLMDFAWRFFRASGLTRALEIIGLAKSDWNGWEPFNGTVLKLGLA